MEKVKEITKELQVGDVLYAYGKYNSGLQYHIVIQRVTNTQAICENVRLKKVARYSRSHDNYLADEIGGTSWFLETDELKEKWQRVQLEKKARNIQPNFSKLTNEQLQQYIDLFTTPSTNR